MQVTTFGIDVAKNVFQLHGVDSKGRVVLASAWFGRSCWRWWRTCRVA